MSAYRKTIQATVTIDGQEHVVTMRAMTYAEALRITDASEIPGADKEAINKARSRVLRDMLPDAVLSIVPQVTDAEGGLIEPREVCNALYFQGAMTVAVEEWVKRSQAANPS